MRTKSFRRPACLALGAILVWSVTVAAVAAPDAAPKSWTNILLMVSDDQGYADLGSSGIGNFKWILDPNGVDRLYDLAEDIDEEHNLAAERPEELAAIRVRWERWRAEMDAAEPRGPFRDY